MPYSYHIRKIHPCSSMKHGVEGKPGSDGNRKQGHHSLFWQPCCRMAAPWIPKKFPHLKSLFGDGFQAEERITDGRDNRYPVICQPCIQYIVFFSRSAVWVLPPWKEIKTGLVWTSDFSSDNGLGSTYFLRFDFRQALALSTSVHSGWNRSRTSSCW